MDPVEMYAQQVGLLQPSAAPAAATAPQTQPLSPVTGTMTDEDILAQLVPGYVGEDQQPDATSGADPQTLPGVVDHPDVAAPAAPAAPTTSTTVKAGTSVGTSGFSQGKNQQVRQGPGAAVDAKIAAINAEAPQEAAANAQPFVDARNNAVVAQQLENDATVKQIDAMGHEKALLAQLQQQYDGQTSEMIAGEQAKASQAKANYVSALNEYRASRINPTQLWDNMSGGERLGGLVVAFVQDFLGAKGIQTSAMATLNKAIDRNIAAQENAIRVKGAATEGFKSLWDMQMQESHSMEETRTRMRGFMLESAKTAIESHMAQFDSALANAKGQAMIAKIDEELAKNIFEVNKHQDAMTSARIGQELARYGDELRASMESARIAVERERNQIERDKNKVQVSPYDNLVYDTTESGGGAPVAEFNSDIKPEERQKFRETQEDAARLVDLTREFQSLQDKRGNQGIMGGTRWQDTDTAKLRNVASEIFRIRAKQFGAALSQQEAAKIQASSPDALFGTQYNVRAVAAQTQQHVQKQLAIKQQAIAHPLHPQDPRRGLPNQRVIQGKAEFDEAGTIASEQDKVKGIETAIKEGRIKGLEKHQANEPVDSDTPKDVYEDHKRFVTQSDVGQSGVAQSEVAPGLKTSMSKEKPKKFEAALTGLARDAQGYKEKAAEGNKHFAARYQENVDVLKHVATPVLTGTNPNDPEALYAVMKLHDLGEDVSPIASESPDVGGSVTAHEEMPQ